jgi:phenylpropionate dioxygenase-like ring-hydroxylating dioxygenase large terminal subunit
MLSHEDNVRITRVGKGTPMGETIRRYWIPALCSEELPENDGAPVRVRLLGEDLVAFRQTDGTVSLVSAFCPHRRAPMFFGRNEENGLRCVYHGWKFDGTGRCTDMPSEPPDSLFKTKVTIDAYPTWEGGGLVWTYMGPKDAMPGHPDYEWIRTPDAHRHVSKTYQECNWLQALEGGLDTAHSSFLHNERVGDSSYLRNRDGHPRLDVEIRPHGYQYVSTRNIGADGQYIRIYQFVMPFQQLRGAVTKWNKAAREDVPTIHGHLWVPIDDTHTWTFNFMYSYDENVPFTSDWAWGYEKWTGRGKDDITPDFRLKKNLENDYQIDRALQKQTSYTGIIGINTQDIALQEGMGPICDRTKEHLGTTDRAIIAARRLLLEATTDVEAGKTPRGADPATHNAVRAHDDIIPADKDWTILAPETVAKW